MWPKSQNSDGDKSGEYGEWRIDGNTLRFAKILPCVYSATFDHWNIMMRFYVGLCSFIEEIIL